MADINNIRTLEDLTNVVSQLYFNLNNIERLYYDMFINPIPMTLKLERYDENGQLGTIYLDNRAKDRQNALTGAGNPNGVQVARTGSLYIDTQTSTLYYKSTGTDAYGWITVWSAQNFKGGQQYLSPTGNGSQLVQLDASNVSFGTLSVQNGGTGVQSLTGIVKASGSNPFTAAIDGVDYMGVDSMTGLVCYYPVNYIPSGWLRCDGAEYSRSTYSKLFNKIGVTYGAGDGSTTFNVPNLMDLFIRGWNGTRPFNSVQQDQVGTHNHNFSGTTETSSGTPTNSTISKIWGAVDTTTTGDFYLADYFNSVVGGGKSTMRYVTIGLRSSGTPHTHSFSGATEVNAEDQETRVKNMALVPIIKY